MTGDPTKPPRVVLASLPEKYVLPGKPSAGTAAALDAYRQANFLLGDELALFERAMNEVLSLIASAKPKGTRGAAMLSVGGRTFSHLGDACALMAYGSYASCLPLLRMALECTAIQRALVTDDFGPYEEWFETAVSQDGAAIRIDLGHSKAASVLVADERLGELYRLLMDLSMPHFGSALLFAAPETSLQKTPLAFADSSFHIGFAQVISGWLLILAGEQLTSWVETGTTPGREATLRGIAEILSDQRRCYVERQDERWVFYNFRRAASGQPKRVILGQTPRPLPEHRIP